MSVNVFTISFWIIESKSTFSARAYFKWYVHFFLQVILIEFLPKYPIFRPDWEGSELWTCSPWIFSLVPCTYILLGRGSPLVSPDDPFHLPLPCTFEFATPSLCFRAAFAHFSPNRTRCLPPWLHSDCFSFPPVWQKKVISAFTPKKHQPRVPVYIGNPLLRMWRHHLPELSLPYCL